MRYDIVVVGSGLIGAIVARLARRSRPEASILVLEAGPDGGGPPGAHRTLTEPDALAVGRARLRAVLSGGDETATVPDEPGLAAAARFGHDTRLFPGAALSWNTGGMGVWWTAACPQPEEKEIPPGASTADWNRDLATARVLLRVHDNPYPWHAGTARIIRSLRGRPMPIAATVDGTGRIRRTAPRDIAPEVFDGPGLRTGTLCTRIVVRSGRVTGVVTHDLASGEEREYGADRVVVAADAFRTPQLLWASGIRPHALGLRLNEHATVEASVSIPGDHPPQPLPGEPFIGAYWLRSAGTDRPFTGQIMEYVGDNGHHGAGLAWYIRTRSRPENRLEFSDTERDAVGLPRFTAHFAYYDDDHAAIAAGTEALRRTATVLGELRSAPVQLPPGASMHCTGTVRLGLDDDVTTVCDSRGAVRGVEGLFAAGNGVVPTELACNVTLTSAALAVRTCRYL